MRISRILLWVLLCSLVLSILVVYGFGAIIGWTPLANVVFAIMWIFNGHLAAAAIALSAFERQRLRRLAKLGVMACPVAVILWAWIVIQGHDLRWLARWGPAVATPFTALAVYAAFVGGLLHLPRAGGVILWLTRVVFILAAVAAVHIVAAVVVRPFRNLTVIEAAAYAETHWRWVGVYLVLIAYVTLAAGAGLYLRKLRAGGRSMVEPIPIRVTCPRCEREQELKTEGDACASCGLRIKVAVA